jgi:periplasmic copper chaperone A
MNIFNGFVARAISVLAILFFSIAANNVAAQNYTVGSLSIVQPYAVPSAFFSRTGAAYIRGISNKGPIADQLISASTPNAVSVEIHTMKMDGDIMRMREIDFIPLPPNAEVTLKHDDRGQNGYHLMLMGLKERLNIGDRFPLTLKFKNAGTLEVIVVVEKSK